MMAFDTSSRRTSELLPGERVTAAIVPVACGCGKPHDGGFNKFSGEELRIAQCWGCFATESFDKGLQCQSLIPYPTDPWSPA